MKQLGRISLTPGSHVYAKGCHYKIISRADQDGLTHVAKDVDTGLSTIIHVADLEDEPREDPKQKKLPDLAALSDDDIREANRRRAAIDPVLKAPYRTKAIVQDAADAAGVSLPTLYRWLRAFEGSQLLSSLIPGDQGRPKGTRLIPVEQEAIIAKVIQEKYLKNQRLKASHIVRMVEDACENAGIAPPGASTVRNRLKEIPAAEALRKRGRPDLARNLHEPIRGKFPGADSPLAVVQIDHTKVDVQVVDERSRQPIGRPWITLAIDGFSRMVTGIYLSMEHPSAAVVGLCLYNAIMPKRDYLADLGVSGEWPVYGMPTTVMSDNGREFHGTMLKLACQEHSILLKYRPVKKPHYGAYIERLMGIAANEFHTLPGTTFSSPSQRKGYNSEKTAALTLKELEIWIVDFLVNDYHQRVHTTLKQPPLSLWRDGISRSGLPRLPPKPERLRLDLLPFFKRTIQPYGLVFFGIHYWTPSFSKYINANDPKSAKQKRKFIFRYDPRNISHIHFYDDDTKEYAMVPYRDITTPPMSLWDLREARKDAAEKGKKAVDRRKIIESHRTRREIVDQAQLKTKDARKRKHRHDVTQSLTKAIGIPAPPPATVIAPTVAEADPYDMPVADLDSDE